MKISKITFGLTKSMNFNSIRADVEIQIDEGDDIDKAWDEARKEAERQCSEDPSWMNKGVN